MTLHPYQGLTIPPKLAIGDGVLGFWKALAKKWPQTAQQRCWVHKTANVLNKVPKSVQPKVKAALHEIWMAETRESAYKALRSLCAGRRHLNRLSPDHTLTSLIQGLGVVRFPGLKRDFRSIGLQKAAEWRFAMVIGHTGAWPITVGPDDDLGRPCQRRKTASASAGWAAKWRIMLAMDCRG